LEDVFRENKELKRRGIYKENSREIGNSD